MGGLLSLKIVGKKSLLGHFSFHDVFALVLYLQREYHMEFFVRGGIYIGQPVAPVAYQVIFEPGIGQFREFEPRRVHTRIHSLGLFLVLKLTCGKRESVS